MEQEIDDPILAKLNAKKQSAPADSDPILQKLNDPSKKKSGGQSLPETGQQTPPLQSGQTSVSSTASNGVKSTGSEEPNYAQLQFNNYIKGLEQEGLKKIEDFKKANNIIVPDQKSVDANAQKAWDETSQQLLPPLQQNYGKWEKERLNYYQNQVNQGGNPDELNKKFEDERLLAHENFINKPLKLASEQWNKQYKSPEIEEYNKKLGLVEQYAKQVDAEINKKADDRIKTIQNFNIQLAKAEENALIRQYPVVGKLKDEFTANVDKLKDQSNIRVEEFKRTKPNEYELQRFADKEKKKLDEAIEPMYQKYRGEVSQIQSDPDFAKGFTESYKKDTFKTQFPITEAIRKGVASMLGDTFLGSQAAGLAGSMSTDFDEHLQSKGTNIPQNHPFTKEEAKEKYIQKVGKAQYEKEKKEWIDKQVDIKEDLSKYSKQQEGEATAYLHTLPSTWKEAKQKGALGISEYIAKNTGGVVGLAAPAVAAGFINPYLGMGVMAQSSVAIEKGEAYNRGIDLLQENTGLDRKEIFEQDLDALLRDESTQSGLINGAMEFVSQITMVGKFLPKGIFPKVLSRILKNAAIQVPASTLIEGSTEWAQAIDTDYASLKGQVDAKGKPKYSHDEVMSIINKNIDEGVYDEDFIGGVTGAIGLSGIGGVHSIVRGQVRKEKLKNLKLERSQRLTQNEELQKPSREIGTEGAIQQDATQKNIQAQEETQVPEAVAGESTVISETPKQQDYGSRSEEERLRGTGEETEEVTQPQVTGEAEVSPVIEKAEEQRAAIKEEIHTLAKEAGIDINTKEFKAASKKITGLSHLDKMNTKNLNKMLQYVQGEKEVNEGTTLLNEFLQEKKPAKPRAKKLSPISNEAKKLVAEYDEEARNPKIPEKDKGIAAILTNTKLDGASVSRFGDKNAITPSMAKQYIVGKGKGATIDQVAAQVSNSLGVEITPEEVWDFMKTYPRGPRTISTPSGNQKLAELSNQYVDLTGRGLNQKIARDIVNKPDFYESIAKEVENSGLDDAQKGAIEQVLYESGVDEVSLQDEEKVLDDVIADYTTDGKVNWKKLQSDIDDVFNVSGNKKISELTNELYGKLRERTETGIQQGDIESNVVEQSEGVQQKGLAERIRSQVRSLRSAKTRAEKVKIANQIIADTGKYLLNREGVITGTDASFADKNSPTFFNLIDEGKSVYLLDKSTKIAETPEDYKKINAKLKDKVTIVSGSLMFDEAFSNGAIQAARDLGYDAIRLTEIDGTNSTLQILNFDKVEHISGEDFVSKISKSKDEKANDLLAEGFSDLADVLGAKKNITGNNAKLNDALVKIGKGLILKGEATIDNVIEKLRDLIKSKGIKVSDEQLQSIKSEITKQAPVKKKKKKGTETSGAKKLSVIERTTDATKKIINETFDGTYNPESNKETLKVTKEFIRKMGGIDEAFEQRNLVAPNVRRLLFAEYMQNLQLKLDEDPANISKYRDAMIELSQLAKNEGQATQIMDFIYTNYGTMFNYQDQILKYVNGDETQLGNVPDEVRRMFKELSEKHKELEKEVARLDKANQDLEDKVSLYNIKQSINRGTNINRQRAEKNIKEAKEEREKLWKELTKMSSARAEIVPVTAITYGVKIANTYLKEGVANVEIAIEKAKDFWKKATGRDFTDEEIEAIRNNINPDWEFGGIKIPSNMIRQLVSEGFDTIEKLTPKVQEYLVGMGHTTITERTVRDIISGYGRMINPSKDELQATINKIKLAGRLTSQLEDVLSGKRPKKSGLQRQPLTTEERAKIREVSRLLRQLPLDDATIDGQLKTAIDAKKSRLKNRIDDLQLAINDGKKIQKNTQLLTDDEIKDLQVQVDEMTKIYESVFDTGKDNLQKVDDAINKLNKSIDYTLDRINNIKDEIYKSEKDKVSSKDIDILKDRLKRLQDIREFMIEESGIAELNRLNSLLKNAKKTEKRMNLALETGNFSRRKIKSTYYNYNLAIDEAELLQQKEKMKYAETAAQKKEIQFNIDLLSKRIEATKSLLKKKSELSDVRDKFLKAQYDKELQDRRPEVKVIDNVRSLIFDLTRGLKAGFDLSIVMIQTMFPTTRFAGQDAMNLVKALWSGDRGDNIKNFESLTKKHLASTFSALKSEKSFDKQSSEIRQSEMYELAKEMGVKISLTDPKAQATEEALKFTAFQKLFGAATMLLGKGIKKMGAEKFGEFVSGSNVPKAFERASHNYAGLVRLEMFSQLATKLRLEGKNPIDNREEYKKAAKYVNDSSGQASLGKAESISPQLALFLFSAKLIAQAIKYATPYAMVHYWKLGNESQSVTDRVNPLKASVAQKAFMQDFIFSIGVQFILMELLVATMNAGIGDDDDKWSIETDPRSSAFGQIRIPGEDGKVTYISPWGPYKTMITFMSRMIKGETKRRDGGIYQLGGRNTPSRLMTAFDFGRNKLAPTPSITADLMDLRVKKDKNRGTYTYTDRFGNEYIFEDEAAMMAMPMYFETIQEAFKSHDPVLAAGLTAMAFFGVGVNTYDETPKKKK